MIVVSEERGRVSLAEKGKLTTVATAAELKGRLDLERFAGQHQPQQRIGLWHRLVRENAGLKLASFGLACLAWFLSSFEADTVQRTFVVPIRVSRAPRQRGDRGCRPYRGSHHIVWL